MLGAGTSILKAFVPTTTMTNVAVKYYTALGNAGIPNGKAQVTSLILTNLTGAAHTFTLHNVPPGGTPVAANMIFSAFNVAANDTQIRTVGGDGVELWNMPAGGEIWALADAGAVLNLTISGREIVG